MRQHLIYDLATRFFHWIFAGVFLTAFAIAKTTDDDTALFYNHMLLGLVLGSLVLWRLFWGIFGSPHARFNNFKLNPKDLLNYFLSILKNDKKYWEGHNPASSWAAVLMLLLAAGLAVSGYLMSNGYKESLEDVHELMANAFIVVVILHIAGVFFHTFRFKDKLPLAMIDGKKKLDGPPSNTMTSHHPVAAFIFLVWVGGVAYSVYTNYDPASKTLKIFNQTLQLGESEQDGGDQGRNNHEEHEDDHE